MLIERIHELVHPAGRNVDEIPGHEAVVDLMVLTIYADDRISTDELEALERFDDEHADWDAGAFSVQQYLPIAVAKVRGVLAEPDGVDAIIEEAASRIVDPSMRETALVACNSIGSVGGIDPAESAMIRRIEQRLG